MEAYGLGLLDYIFIGGILLIVLISTGLGIKDDDGEVGIRVFMFFGILYLIITLPLMYYYNIPNGTYNAKFIEIENMKIGEGTEQSKSFEIKKTDDKITISHKYKYLEFKLKESKNWDDNIYVKYYQSAINEKEYLTLTRFGYVMTHDEKGKITSKIEVDY